MSYEWSDPSATASALSSSVVAVWGRSLLAVALGYLILQHGPFARTGLSVVEETAENAGRQAVWLILCVTALPLAWRERNRFHTIIARMPFLVAAIGWCWISVTWAADSVISLKRVVLLTIVLSVFISAAAAVRRPAALWQTVALLLAGILAVDLVSALAFPSLGREASGNFAGMHQSKNTAGAITALTLLVWFFTDPPRKRTWWRWLRALVLLGGLVFLAGTGSKTSLASVLVSGVLAVFLAVLARTGPLTAALGACLVMTVGGAVALVVVVLSPQAVLTLLYGDATLTGRTVLWEFLWPSVEQHPWLGLGYQSLWLTGGMGMIERWSPTTLNWAVHQAHNGYLDLLLTIGTVGLALVAVTLLSGLGRALKAQGADAGNGVLILAVLIFAMIHNITESSLLRADHAVWGVTLLALLSGCLTKNGLARRSL